MLSTFFKKRTPERLLRENKRLLNSAVRSLDIEIKKVRHQERLIMREIQCTARMCGKRDAIKPMAMNLTRYRKQAVKITKMKGTIHGVLLSIHTLNTSNAMGKAMSGVTRALQGMNSRMNLSELRDITMNFEKQIETMNMKGELLDEVVEDMLEGSDEDDDSDFIMSRVFDELGLSLSDNLPPVPSAPYPQRCLGALRSTDVDLEVRLDNLRRK